MRPRPTQARLQDEHGCERVHAKTADHIEKEDKIIIFTGTGSGKDTGFLFMPNTVGKVITVLDARG